jgi:hypothetical protein
VDRGRLLDFSGRSRKPQIALAATLGIAEFPAPAGGCLLTEKTFSRRLKDLFDHQATTPENDLHLLRFGRHLRLDAQTKIVVGRTRQDNEQINRWVDPQRDTVIKVDDYPGPLVVMPGGGAASVTLLAAGICAGYSKATGHTPVKVNITANGLVCPVMVTAIGPAESKRYLI